MNNGSQVVVKVPHLIIGELPPRLRKRARDYFAYGTEFLPLPAGGTLTNSINIESDSDFAIVSAVGVVTSVNNLTLVAFPAIMADMRDTGSGRVLSNIPMHFTSVFGDAQNPFIFWRAGYLKRLRASGTFQVTLQNLDPGNAVNVRLTFHGFKVYDFPEE